MTILKDLELSVRAHNVLLDYGKVHTLNDFLALTRAKVMSLPKAGVRTWNEIAHIQNALRADPPEVQKEDLTALRDAAALAALQGIMAHEAPEQLLKTLTGQSGLTTGVFIIADAFIAARESKEGEE